MRQPQGDIDSGKVTPDVPMTAAEGLSEMKWSTLTQPHLL